MNEGNPIHPSPPPQPHKHFMSLGGDLVLPPKKNILGTPSLSPSTLSSSFSISRRPQHSEQLPDIYTTCPELRKFKALMFLNTNEDQNSENEKYQRKTIEQPPAEIKQPPVENYQQSPQPQQPVQNISQVSYIQPPASPVFFTFQRCPMTFQPIPFYQYFDPNAPVLRPHELGFVPKSEWPPQVLSLWDLRRIYFTRRNGACRRFDFKLYNALCITKVFPPAYAYIGAMWIGPTLMKINSQTFAALLGIHAIQGGLFHKQGNFSRHGFQQIQKSSPHAMQLNLDLRDVDDYNIRLFTDQFNRFSRDTEFVITDQLPIANEDDEEEDAAS